VIAGIIPVHFLAAERTERYLRKNGINDKSRVAKEAREKTIVNWQKEWDVADNGRWTRRMIADLNVWIGRKHGTVDFHMTQFLSGHGCFRYYLHRFNPSMRCVASVQQSLILLF